MCATRNASSGPRIETSATSFCSAMKSFRSGGITRRTACGSTTWRVDCADVRPSESAAEVWPGWIDSMPARYPRELERGDAEADQVDDEDDRKAAEDVGIARGQETEREQRRGAARAHQRDDQAQRQHGDLHDHEDLDVEPEAVEHVREGVLEGVPVEEGLADVGPALARQDQRGERAEHDDTREACDRRAPG